MIEFENVTKEYSGESVLDSISFKVNRGEKCGLVGRNGTGKTTILRLITKEENPDFGKLSLPKDYKIGYLTQHLHFTQPTLLEEGALALPEEEKEMLYKAEKILFGLGFKEEDMQKNPTLFSGGYQLRIHLAKVLISEPDCLLLDEPTNYLDIVSIRWFIRFLKAWRGEFILISHDHDFMDSVTTHTLGLHRKKIFKVEGGTEKYYTQLLEAEEIHEKTRMSLEKKRSHLESFITRFGAKASKAGQAQSKAKALAKMPVLEELAKLHHLDFKFPHAPFGGQKIVSCEHLFFAYENMKDPLISDFSLDIEKKDRIAVIGKNGRGKSTLLRLIAQDLKPDRGIIRLSENARIGFFGQTNIDRLHREMTVEEEITASAPHLHTSQIRKICGIMMFSSNQAKKPIKVLSGGERSRVLLGKLLVSPCNLLLLDEPTNHLDMESIEALVDALEIFEGAIIIVTHSEMILRELASKFVVCHSGSQHLFTGDYDQFLEKEGWEEEEKVKKKKSTGDTREERRQKAENIQKRAGISKPLQERMKQIEAEILSLEQEKEKEMQKFLVASQKKEGALIAELARSMEMKKRRIDLLFSELEETTRLFEEKRSEFENLS